MITRHSPQNLWFNNRLLPKLTELIHHLFKFKISKIWPNTSLQVTRMSISNIKIVDQPKDFEWTRISQWAVCNRTHNFTNKTAKCPNSKLGLKINTDKWAQVEMSAAQVKFSLIRMGEMCRLSSNLRVMIRRRNNVMLINIEMSNTRGGSKSSN